MKSKDKRQSDANEDFEDEIEQLKIENKKLANIIVKLQEDKKNRKGIDYSIHHQVKNSKNKEIPNLIRRKESAVWKASSLVEMMNTIYLVKNMTIKLKVVIQSFPLQ